MANTVTTRCTAAGPEAQIADLRNLVAPKHGRPFDFERLCPTPPILAETELSTDVDIALQALGRPDLCTLVTEPFAESPWAIERGLTTPEQLCAYLEATKPASLAKARRGIAAASQTGARNAYEWCVQHWGTKWNSFEVELIRDDARTLEWCFVTAGDFPRPIFARLSKRHGGCLFYCEWFESGWNFAGWGTWLDGEVDFEIVEATQERFDSLFGRTERGK